MATNFEMIADLAGMVGYEFDGTNLKTFMEWKKEGYSVIKGEKACMKLELWKPFTAKVKNEETGEYEKDEKGNIKTETRFKLVPSSLFSIEQVEKKGEPTKKAEVVALTVEVEVKEEVKEEEVKEVTEASEVVEMTIKFEEEEATEADVKKARFESKPSNILEVQKGEISSYDRYVVKEEVTVSDAEFKDLCNNLIMDNTLFDGFKGGTDSTTMPDVPDNTSWFDLTPKQQEYFLKGSYRECMQVTSNEAGFYLLIDPQGYNYARYVAIVNK
jgi:hypothetical protein